MRQRIRKQRIRKQIKHWKAVVPWSVKALYERIYVVIDRNVE